MRIRRKPWARPELAEWENCIDVPAENRGKWKSFFKNNAPMMLELGCGKGGFACGMAEAHPERRFLALEKVPDVMVIALEQAEERRTARSCDNLRFLIANAADLALWFAPHTLDAIYLNFSDPWPKARHAQRRLTHRALIEMYLKLLRDGGQLHFKTDNRPLFDFTLEELSALGLTPDDVTYDLHHSPYNEGNIRTEYEDNFSAKGFSINALRLTVRHAKTAEQA